MAASLPLAPYDFSAASAAPYADYPTAPTVYQYPGGLLELLPQYRGFRVSLSSSSPAVRLRGRTEVETGLPAPLIHRIAATYGLAETAEVIARHQDREGLPRVLGRQLEAYFPHTNFAGKRILDFGCGCGASTRALAWLLPASEIIGVDFDLARLELAEAILAAHEPAPENLAFRLCPSSLSLPSGLGPLDFVVMSAAFHHLLPAERRLLLPLLWKLLKPGGALLFSQTPHRWLPWEPEVTGLMLLNYLPDRLAGFLARHFSSQNEDSNRDRDWTDLLRAGIRGASEREIVNLLPATAEVLRPANSTSRADYWRDGMPEGPSPLLWAATELFRRTERRWGVVPSPHLDLVIRKHG